MAVAEEEDSTAAAVEGDFTGEGEAAVAAFAQVAADRVAEASVPEHHLRACPGDIRARCPEWPPGMDMGHRVDPEVTVHRSMETMDGQPAARAGRLRRWRAPYRMGNGIPSAASDPRAVLWHLAALAPRPGLA
jgi:hypothetical protein